MKHSYHKILEVVLDHSPYNLEETTNIVKNLVDRGEKEISIFSKEIRLINYSKGLGNQKFCYYEIPRENSKVFSIVKFYSSLRKILKQKEINLLKIDYNVISVLSFFILKKGKFNLIIDLSNNRELKDKITFIEKLVLSKAGKVIAPSLYGVTCLEKLGVEKNKIIYITNSVNQQIFSPENISNNRITQFSEKIRLKNFDNFIFTVNDFLHLEEYFLLIESFKELNIEDFVCIFVIESNVSFFAKKIDQKLKELGLKTNIIYLNEVSDVAALYKLSDLVIFPFIKNRISSNKINEARSMGKLVLVTESDYSLELIKDGETGFLCQKNQKKIAEKIKFILELDEIIKQKIQNESINFVYNHFSVRQKAKKIIELYDNIEV